MKTYFVANNNGDILGHDLDLAAAEQCLSAALKDDPNNEQEWEILSDDDEDDLTFSLLLNLHRVSMAELNRRYGIPKRTMEDWKSGRRTPPEWVLTLLQVALDSNLIGTKVVITNKESQYCNEWGTVLKYDGDSYHIAIANGTGSVPIFDRDEFKPMK